MKAEVTINKHGGPAHESLAVWQRDMTTLSPGGTTPDLGDGDAFEGVHNKHTRDEVARPLRQVSRQVVDASLSRNRGVSLARACMWWAPFGWLLRKGTPPKYAMQLAHSHLPAK